MLKPMTEILPVADHLDDWSPGRHATVPESDPQFDPYKHPLRRHSKEDFEKAIAGGLVELTGPDFRARIIKLDFQPKSSVEIAGLSEAVELVVRILPITDPDADDEPEAADVD